MSREHRTWVAIDGSELKLEGRQRDHGEKAVAEAVSAGSGEEPIDFLSVRPCSLHQGMISSAARQCSTEVTRAKQLK